MGFLDRLRRRRRPRGSKRRELLLRMGRLTEGRILDARTVDGGQEIIHFTYSVNGVDFEALEFLTPEQSRRPADYAPGASVNIRFEPGNHGNSIVV